MSRRAALLSWALLAAYVVVLLVISWRRWGNPLGDTGLDLTVAAGWLDGVLPYRDVRYWYGPLGIGVLAGAFAVLGTHLWVAMAVGLAQTALIVELVRRLARRWLPVPTTAAVVAVVLSIGFSGTGSNFQLPHTFAATTGLVALLFALLAFSHERFGLAGLAVGATALSRPELFAFGIAALGGAAFGAWRTYGFIPAARRIAVAIGTALLVAVPVLGWFAAEAGLYRVLFENIVPLDFLRASGADFERGQHPFDLLSLGMLLLRGSVLVAGSWAFVALWTVAGSRGRSGRHGLPTGSARLLAGVAVAVVAGMLCAVLAGQADQPASLLRDDISRFLIAMTALPAVALAMLLVAAVAWLRGRPSPLDDPSVVGGGVTRSGSTVVGGAAPRSASSAVDGAATRSASSVAAGDSTADPLPVQGRGGIAGSPGWVAGGALVATAAAAALRSYNFFSTDVYAPYYAPPVVLVAGIVLHRVVARSTGDRAPIVVPAVLALAALSLSLHAYVGLYRDFTVRVQTPRGTYLADAEGGGGEAARATFALLSGRIAPSDRLLAMPQEPGFYFLTGARPALYDSTFLPGVLPTRAADEAAARALLTGAGVPRQNRPAPGGPYVPPRYAIEANWNFELWGYRRQGLDVNVALHRALIDRYRVIGRFGDTETLPPKVSIGRAFTVYELR